VIIFLGLTGASFKLGIFADVAVSDTEQKAAGRDQSLRTHVSGMARGRDFWMVSSLPRRSEYERSAIVLYSDS
jgi:hypothetical protein